MIAELIKAGYFRQRTLDGRSVWVLKSPLNVVVPAATLAQLKAAYPLNEETGGILYAYPSAGSLVITRFVILPNQLGYPTRKTAYQPAGSGAVIRQVLAAGALPIRFHSHPLSIYENPYDRQPLLFFQKTSVADRHNSYLPLTVDGYTLVMPDGLLSPNDRSGSDIRFYLYGGLVAPDSIQALLTSEKVYIYFALIAVLLAYLLGGFRRSLVVFGLAGLLSVIVFVMEKRPTGVRNADGDLVISIP